MRLHHLFPAVALGLLSACASAPVQFYTLAPVAGPVATPPRNAAVVYVPRVVMPDYLDTQDILVRDDSRLLRSSNGRWASRLSQSATDLIVARLSRDWPQAMVTAYAPVETPDSRLSITMERLDMTSDGKAVVLASWTRLPRDETRPVRQGRSMESVQGSVATDQEKAALLRQLFEKLADRIAAESAG